MSSLVVLRVDRTGYIFASNEAAGPLLASASSRRCSQVVNAVDSRGEQVCTADCALKLSYGYIPPRCRINVQVRGEGARLSCQRVGDETVVVIEASDEASDSAAFK